MSSGSEPFHCRQPKRTGYLDGCKARANSTNCRSLPPVWKLSVIRKTLGRTAQLASVAPDKSEFSGDSDSMCSDFDVMIGGAFRFTPCLDGCEPHSPLRQRTRELECF